MRLTPIGQAVVGILLLSVVAYLIVFLALPAIGRTGLPPQTAMLYGSGAVAVGLIVTGLVLMAFGWRRESPWAFHFEWSSKIFKVAFPALPFVGGLAMLAFVVWVGHGEPAAAPPPLDVGGKILYRGKPLAGIMVGVLEGKSVTVTDSQGEYLLTVPRSPFGNVYQAVSFIANTNPPEVVIRGVTIDGAGRGRFDHDFRGEP